MSIKKAKLNLDFGYSEIRLNFAVAEDIQPRNGVESDWGLVSLGLGTDIIDDKQEILESSKDSYIQKKAAAIGEKIKEWQKDNGYDFDPLAEVTISAAYFNVVPFRYVLGSSAFCGDSSEFSASVPYVPNPSSKMVVNEEYIRKMEQCKKLDVAAKIQMPDRTVKTFISPYFLISNGKDLVPVLNPIGRKTESLGFMAYFITEDSTISKMIDIMKKEGDRINVSLSCEKEFAALANIEEKSGKTLYINITDSISEFSIWDSSELKYLNKKNSGLKELKNLTWRLCLYYKKVELMSCLDYELTQNDELMRDFYNRVKEIEISKDSMEILSADDCAELLGTISCVLERETEYSIKVNRLAVPGKNNSKTNLSISNYVLSYFAREAIRTVLSEIKQTIDSDKFCEYSNILLKCPLPLKGIEKVAEEVFSNNNVRRGIAMWDGEIKDDFSAAGIGALQSLISDESFEAKENKKKTSKFQALLGSLFNRA